jgi:hypothetical protein
MGEWVNDCRMTIQQRSVANALRGGTRLTVASAVRFSAAAQALLILEPKPERFTAMRAGFYCVILCRFEDDSARAIMRAGVAVVIVASEI